MKSGILVASDERYEWLLPWWWHHYSIHNTYPVAFADFGMSQEALAWCREKGTVLSLPETRGLKEVPSLLQEKWETRYGRGIWRFRSAWFKKPLAHLYSPFSLSCWLDLDCEVLGNLKPLFDSLGEQELALVREPEEIQKKDREQEYLLPEEVSYNSGVMVFRPQSPILREWAQAAADGNHRFLGDQTILSRLIYLHDTPIQELDPKFNWFKQLGPNPEALIIHYVQGWKQELLEMARQRISPFGAFWLGSAKKAPETK